MKFKKLSLVESTLATMLILFFILSVAYAINNKTIRSSIENINEKLPMINYKQIDAISGKYYYEDNNYYSSFGIDVSEFQGRIDWQKVKDDGVEFVYIRMGRRGATTGLLYLDDKFEENYNGAKDNGLKIGVYFFSQAINEKEAKEEANFVIKNIKDKEIDLPIALDYEEITNLDEAPRIDGLDKEQLTKNALAFSSEINKYRYKVIYYTYYYWTQTYYDMEQIVNHYPIWFAQYNVDEPELEYPITIWQYSNKGTINGINEDVDLNIMFIKK